MATTFTHVGITVTDHEASKRFYCEALGFTPTVSIDGGPEFDGLMEMDGLRVLAEFLTNGSQVIELVSYTNPKVQGEPERGPMNRLGLTHLCFLVDDIDTTAAKVAELGGSVLEHTRIAHDIPDGVHREYIFCTDPDGVRVELIAAPKLPNVGDEVQLQRRGT